jgi:hypothetical protein
MTTDRIMDIVQNWMNDHDGVMAHDSDRMKDLENRLRLADAITNGVKE